MTGIKVLMDVVQHDHREGEFPSRRVVDYYTRDGVFLARVDEWCDGTVEIVGVPGMTAHCGLPKNHPGIHGDYA